MRILVTDGTTRAALAIVRSLGRQHDILVVARDAASLAGASRFAARHEVLPDALTSSPATYASHIMRWVHAEYIEVVIPVTDASCVALLPYRDQLSPCVLAAPRRDAFERLSDKAEVASLGGKHGIAVPEGKLASGPEEAVAVARLLGFPVVVKPQRSVDRRADGTLARYSVTKARDESALREQFRSLGGSAALVQKSVAGGGAGVSLLRWAGCTRAAFAHRRVREKPPAGGVSVLSESIGVDASLRSGIEAILEEVDFEGLAMAEFKIDGDRSWLMEFNARPWGSMQLAIDAGVDFPRLLLDCVDGRPPLVLPEYIRGRRLRWWLGDLDHAIALARGGAAADGRRGPVAGLRTLLGPTGPGSKLELLRREDPRPFVAALLRWLRRIPE